MEFTKCDKCGKNYPDKNEKCPICGHRNMNHIGANRAPANNAPMHSAPMHHTPANHAPVNHAPASRAAAAPVHQSMGRAATPAYTTSAARREQEQKNAHDERIKHLNDLQLQQAKREEAAMRRAKELEDQRRREAHAEQLRQKAEEEAKPKPMSMSEKMQSMKQDMARDMMDKKMEDMKGKFFPGKK